MAVTHMMYKTPPMFAEVSGEDRATRLVHTVLFRQLRRTLPAGNLAVRQVSALPRLSQMVRRHLCCKTTDRSKPMCCAHALTKGSVLMMSSHNLV